MLSAQQPNNFVIASTFVDEKRESERERERERELKRLLVLAAGLVLCTFSCTVATVRESVRCSCVVLVVASCVCEARTGWLLPARLRQPA